MNRILAWLDRLPDPVARALRTFLQTFIVVLLIEIVGGGTVVVGISTWGSYLDAATIGALAAMLSYIQNAAEERGVIRPTAKNQN